MGNTFIIWTSFMVYVLKSKRVIEMDVICHIKDLFKLLTLESEQSVHIAGFLCSFVNKTFNATHPPFLQIFKNRGLLNVIK